MSEGAEDEQSDADHLVQGQAEMRAVHTREDEGHHQGSPHSECGREISLATSPRKHQQEQQHRGCPSEIEVGAETDVRNQSTRMHGPK